MIIMDSFSNDTEQTRHPVKTERSSLRPDTPDVIESMLKPNVLING